MAGNRGLVRPMLAWTQGYCTWCGLKHPGHDEGCRLTPGSLPSVRQGEITVNRAQVLLEGRKFCAWELDLHAKYATVGTYGGRRVFLIADDRTLKVNESLSGSPTIVILPERFSDWSVMAEAARYTCRIVAWKPGRRGPWLNLR